MRTNGCHFVKHHVKTGPKCPDFKWSSFWIFGIIAISIAKALPFENRTIRNTTFKKSGFQIFQDFEWSDFRSPLYKQLLKRFQVYITCHASLRISRKLKHALPNVWSSMALLCFLYVAGIHQTQHQVTWLHSSVYTYSFCALQRLCTVKWGAQKLNVQIPSVIRSSNVK